MISSGTLYLLIAAALIFGACTYAAKRILRQLTRKQLGIIALISLATILVIWGFLFWAGRESVSLPREISEPEPRLRPTPP